MVINQLSIISILFFFNDTATTEIYTLSLHDALPIYKDNFAKSGEEELLDSGQKDEYGQRLQANPETSGRYHSDWLSMMYPRLKLARNLLTEDGDIFISIGVEEVANMKKIMDEIFGESNFIEVFSWVKTSTPPALSTKSRKTNEYI